MDYIVVIIIGIVLFVAELFVGTLDLFMLGLAAVITGVLMYIFDITDLFVVASIYFVLGVFLVTLSRVFLFRPIPKVATLSQDASIGQVFEIVDSQHHLCIYVDGRYRCIADAKLFESGESVVLEGYADGFAIVKKK